MFLNQAAFPHWVLHQKPFAPKACTPGTFTPCNFHTRGRLQQNFLQRIFTAKPVKTSSASPKGLLYTCEGFYTKGFLQQNMLTPGTLYTPKSFTPEGFCTKCTSHQRVVTPEDLLHVGHNCALHQNISTPGGFSKTFLQGEGKTGGGKPRWL